MFWKLLAGILASIYDFAVNIVMAINNAIHKTFIIHDYSCCNIFQPKENAF